VSLADPIDRAVALAFRGELHKDRLHQTPAAKVMEDALAREAGVIPRLVEVVAKTIYSYDQDYVDRPWSRLGAGSRQTYIEIAEAVIARVRAA
jgi:hypothetical protein